MRVMLRKSVHAIINGRMDQILSEIWGVAVVGSVVVCCRAHSCTFVIESMELIVSTRKTILPTSLAMIPVHMAALATLIVVVLASVYALSVSVEPMLRPTGIVTVQFT